MRCCSLFRELDEILELFFNCTQLPIAALTPEGEHTCSHCKPLHVERLKEKRPKAVQGEIKITTPNGEPAAYYVVPICPCAKKPGVFVMGPYANNKDGNSSFSYRAPESFDYLVSLLRNIQGVNQTAALTCTRKDKPYCLPIHRAKNIILKHYDEQISLETTAEHLGLNKSYLSTLFKEETGQTFTEFVNEVRINKSIKLLRETSHSILDIALQVGFSNQNYYSRIFKKLTGVTPSEFRQLSMAQLD